MRIIHAGRDAVTRLGVLADSCTVFRYPEPAPVDESMIEESPVLIYSGPCRVKPASPEETQVAGLQFDQFAYTVTLPWSADGVNPGDVVHVVSGDGDLNGSNLTVDAVRGSTMALLRRLYARKTHV